MITERSQMKNLRPLVFVWSSLTLYRVFSSIRTCVSRATSCCCSRI